MVVFPSCKINLGLHVIRKRSDGYHDIETCFYPIPWTDILEIIRSDRFLFSQTGIQIGGSDDDNLCIRAYNMLKMDFDLPPVSIHLHKIIPAGAGLGGGSSDAAHTLRLLNAIFALNLSVDELRQYALALGSDCPFFITQEPMIGTSRGEALRSIAIPDLNGKFIVIVKPGTHISTKEAYSGVAPAVQSRSIDDILLHDTIDQWKKNLVNDFEGSVLRNHPEIQTIKETLYEYGALYASMTGSGSGVYGLFAEAVDLREMLNDYSCWSGKLSF